MSEISEAIRQQIKSSEDPYFSAPGIKIGDKNFILKIQNFFFGFVMIFTGVTGIFGIAFLRLLFDSKWAFGLFLGWVVLQFTFVLILSRCDTLNEYYAKE
jgi:hypothetical protein